MSPADDYLHKPRPFFVLRNVSACSQLLSVLLKIRLRELQTCTGMHYRSRNSLQREFTHFGLLFNGVRELVKLGFVPFFEPFHEMKKLECL